MVPSNSSINRLDPFLHSDNIICVSGRLRKPGLTEAEQHPIILPRKNAVSNELSNGVIIVSPHERKVTVEEIWSALFTCFSCHAIRIEVTNALDTKS